MATPAGSFGNVLSGLAGPDLRPTPDRPLFHETDPEERDRALQRLAGIGINTGLAIGGAGLGGPEAITLKNLMPGIFQAALGPFTRSTPGLDQGIMYPLFHGTTRSFQEFDPNLSEDLGMHFGTLEQASNRVRGWVPKDTDPSQLGYAHGGNIRPVHVDIENPVRLPDVFSRGFGPRRLMRILLDSDRDARARGFKEPGLKFSPENEKAMEEIANNPWVGREADIWKVVQKQMRENGHDGIVYENELEGPGDSYVAFDPGKVTPRFGASPSQLAPPPKPTQGPPAQGPPSPKASATPTGQSGDPDLLFKMSLLKNHGHLYYIDKGRLMVGDIGPGAGVQDGTFWPIHRVKKWMGY